MEKLIVIEEKHKYKYDNLENLVEDFISKNYYNISTEEKGIILEKKAAANSIRENIKTIKIERYPDDFEENSFIVSDEISYILSMLKFNKIILLERTDANIFGKYIDKEWIKDNYIIVNKFADEILKKYLEEEYYGWNKGKIRRIRT